MQARFLLVACSTYEAYQQIARLQGLAVESKAKMSFYVQVRRFLHAGLESPQDQSLASSFW
jgi:hypothetical protein